MSRTDRVFVRLIALAVIAWGGVKLFYMDPRDGFWWAVFWLLGSAWVLVALNRK